VRPATYCKALEAEEVPAVVLGCIRDVEAEHLAAEDELAARTASEPISASEVRTMVKFVRRRLRGPRNAKPGQRQVPTGSQDSR
jgi:hypothetical protein